MVYMKRFLIVIFVICFIITCSSVYAIDDLNEVFSKANDWFSSANAPTNAGTNTVGGALAGLIGKNGTVDLVSMLFEIGNLIILVVTIALGLKYIYSGIEGKADIKSALPNYVLGIVFFYLSDAVWALSKGFMTGTLGTGNSYETFSGNIFSIISTMANIFAILGIVLVGLKYMLSPADTKADVKKQLIPVVLGIALVYAGFRIVDFIYDIANGII